MTTPEAVLNVARRELGTSEEPPGSNKTKYGAWYGMNGKAWCAMFVSWVAHQAGAKSIIPKHAWTPDGVKWFKARNAYGKQPRVGAVVYFFNAEKKRVDHVGFVEAVHQDGSITTIEGNSSDIVKRVKRRANIDGYGYPEYSDQQAPGKRVPDMLIVRYGRSVYRLITGDRYVGITAEFAENAHKAGIPMTGIPAPDHEALTKALTSEG